MNKVKDEMKKKAMCCTVLLAMVICVIIGCLGIINIDLLRCVFALMAGDYVGKKLEDFYNWLMTDK